MIEHKLLPLAEKYESENAWSEAYNTYTQIYSEVRTDEALEKLAWCASRAELYDDAIKFYILLTEHQPQNAKFLYNVGYQYYATKKWAEANEWFYKALNLHPNYFVVKYRLGYSLRQLCGNHLVLKKNEFWQALKQFSECEKLWDTMDKESQKHNATTFADVCFQKGKLLLERKHLQEAIFYFEKSLFIKPKNNEDCEYQLAKTYFEIGNIQKAEECIPKNSKKYYVKELNIDILVRLERLYEAEKLLKKLLLHRNKDYLHRRLAEILVKQGKTKEAFSSINKAVTLNPKNHINHYYLSKMLLDFGMLCRAENEAENAIRLKKITYNTEYTDAITLLGQIRDKKIAENYQEDSKEQLQFLASTIENNSNQNEKSIGVISKYNSDRGYGFIMSDNKKYFFHISTVKKKLQNRVRDGLKVSFCKSSSKKGLSAQDIELLE